MCGGCGRRPPEELCRACHEANDGCTCYCRDSFIYDTSRPELEIVEELRQKYQIGGLGGEFETPLRIPESILALVSQSPQPGELIRKLVRDLRDATIWWPNVRPGEKPMVADSPLELETTDTGLYRIVHRLEGEHHIYVELYTNGEIAITFSLPMEDDIHELLLKRGKEPLYTHDSSKPSSGFPEERFVAWLKEAIKASDLL